MFTETKHTPKIKHAPEKSSLEHSLGALKNTLTIHPILSLLEAFDSFFKKKKRSLQEHEVLFSPGENPYFYIISSWALSILRMTPTGDKKEIGRAYTGSILGEGVLFDRNQKDVEAQAIGEATSVIVLTKEDIASMERENPEKILALYKQIIEMGNGRLLETGKELAALYEMNTKIDELSKFGEQGFKGIVDHIAKTLSVDYILSVEQHPAVPGLFVHKYNSRFPSVWPINQKMATNTPRNSSPGEIESTGEILGTDKDDTLYLFPLTTRENLKGYFILWKRAHGTFQDTDIRMMNNIAPLLGSMIENNQTIAEKKALHLKQGTY